MRFRKHCLGCIHSCVGEALEPTIGVTGVSSANRKLSRNGMSRSSDRRNCFQRKRQRSTSSQKFQADIPQPKRPSAKSEHCRRKAILSEHFVMARLRRSHAAASVSPLASKLLKSTSSRKRGSLIPAPLAPAASSRVESFSASTRDAHSLQIENCFSVRLRAKLSAPLATARPPAASSPTRRGSSRRTRYLRRRSLFRERSRRRCGRLPE